MEKSVTTTNRNQAPTPAAQRTLRLAAVIRENLYDFVIGEGMKAVQELLERDRELLCGPKHGKGTKEDAKRWGTTDGRLVIVSAHCGCWSRARLRACSLMATGSS